MLSENPKIDQVQGKANKPSAPAVQASRGSSEPGPGDVVDGRYRLLEPLGQGGMGVVWKARSTALDVDVAVKLVRGAMASPESFKRMAREAHAAARLGHPAVARVLDFGSIGGTKPFVVMELLHGESLADRLHRQSTVAVVEAISLLLPLIEGLAEAHDQGIVHRDIKPENLFLAKTSRGGIQPKVLDFGIAKLDQQSDSSTKLTQDGAVLGSPGYFSPEQACGRLDIDHRTDIWSVTVVLYELITGQLPFSGPNYNALLMSILQDQPKSLLALGHGDEALWAIVRRGMATDRNDRWQSMACLGQALAEWLIDQGVRSDITARSLRDVWLRPGDSVESAATPFAPTKGEPAKLATLLARHESDTLAGGTLSLTRGGPKRTAGPAKAMAVAAVGAMATLSWYSTQDSSSARSVATSAVPRLQASQPVTSTAPPAIEMAPRIPAQNASPHRAAAPTPAKPKSSPQVAVAPLPAATSKAPAKTLRKAAQKKPSPWVKARASAASKAEKKSPKATSGLGVKREINSDGHRIVPASRKPGTKASRAAAPVEGQKIDAEFGF